MRNGKMMEIKGEDTPGFEGKVCGKAFAEIGGRIYMPDRILHLLKKIGERGQGTLTKCTWEEVINTGAVNGGYIKYIHPGHPEAFEIWWGCAVQTDNIYFLRYWAAVLRAGISYMHGQVRLGEYLSEKAVIFGNNHGQ